VSVKTDNSLPVRIFPNPMGKEQEVLQISIDERLKKEAILLSVYNMLGKAVCTKNVIVQGPGPITVQLENKLIPGVYFVSGSAAQPLFYERLVVR